MELVLDRVGSSIEKYNWIMKRVQEVDVSADADFQRFFNGFYRIRQRPASFYKAYYAFMEQHKHDPALTFEDVLTHLYGETGTMQASFSSKLLATVNPDMPLWDKYVLQSLGLRPPYSYEKDRLSKIVRLYQHIIQWYRTDEAVEKLHFFNEQFPDAELSDVKKVDFILWASR